jgi:hypothetical protein
MGVSEKSHVLFEWRFDTVFDSSVRVEKIKITSRPANTLIGPGENSRSHNDYGHDKIRAKANEIETFFTSTNMH